MTLQEELQNLLERYATEFVNQEGAFCTGFVLFAEYLDSNSEFYTFTIRDGKSPVWRLQGLVDYLRETELAETREEGDY